MTIICQDIGTISGSYSLLCGKLIKIYDIRSGYETIDIMIESRISPQVGFAGNAFTIGNARYTISLISKNVATGTAIVQLTISTIDVLPPPPVVETTHHLEFYVKPHSWYSPGGAAEDITLKLSDISGTIINAMSKAGLFGWEYVSTDVISDTSNNQVIIRVNLNEIGAMSKVQSMAIGPWMIIGIAVAVVIIGIGIITGWALIKTVNQILGETFSGKQVGEHDKAILDNMKLACADRFPNNAIGYANCIGAGVEAVTGASADFFKDDSINKAGDDAVTKIDICIQQYNAGQITATQLVNCSNVASDNVGGAIVDKTKDKDGGSGGLLLLGVGLVALYIVSKSSEKVATPVLIERERLREERSRTGIGA